VVNFARFLALSKSPKMAAAYSAVGNTSGPPP
jgi:hypothetical protein